MLPWVSDNATGFELLLWGCALGGSLFFLLRVLMMMIGGVGAEDLDVSVDADADMHDVDSHSTHHTEAAFKLFSLNSILAFVMMFGWSGLTASVQFDLGFLTSFLIALVVGSLTMALTAYMFLLMRRFVSEGANFKTSDLVGHTGTVYVRIPAQGKGRVHITLNGILREIDAVAGGDEQIDSFTSVKVSKLLDDNTVFVERTEA